MKKLILIFLFLSSIVYSQSPIVHDPTNNVQLVSMGATMTKMTLQYEKITERLNTISEINNVIKVAEMLATIEQSACVVADLNYYWELSSIKLSGNSNCFGEININMAITSIRNAVGTIDSALSSKLFALNERTENVVNSFETITTNTEKLYKVKEILREDVETNEEIDEFVTLLYGK